LLKPGSCGVGLGVFLAGGHRSYVLLVKGSGNESAGRTDDEWHRDVEDRPAIHAGALVGSVFGLEGVVDVQIDRRSELLHGDGVVEVGRSRPLQAGDGDPDGTP
jgi:hypothetical protein